MKIVEKFFSVPWDNFNFALERLSLILCSMSARDLTDYQMQAAGRVCMTSFTSILYIIRANSVPIAVYSARSSWRSRRPHVTMLQVPRDRLRTALFTTWKRRISDRGDRSNCQPAQKRGLSNIQETQGGYCRDFRADRQPRAVGGTHPRTPRN